MKRIRLLFIIASGLFLYTICLSALVRNVLLAPDKGESWGVVGQFITNFAELPSQLKKYLGNPEFYVQNNEAIDGLQLKEGYKTTKYPHLLVSYKTEPFKQAFELVELESGRTIKKWSPDNKELFDMAYNPKDPRRPPKGSDLYFMHALMLSDSSLIFNSQLTSLLTRIDSSGKIVWLKNDRNYHHTSEMDHTGMIWVCSRPFIANDHGFLPNSPRAQSALMDDEITQLNPSNGEILFRKSVISILQENGYENLVLQKGQVISDPIHLNDVQPALSDGPYWKRGDLLISCRNLSTVFLYNPSENKIKWIKQGPWYNQHDTDFLDSTKVSIFGNDIIREESVLNPKITQENLFFTPNRPTNDIYIYDLAKDSIMQPYSELMRVENIRTTTSGRSQILDNGDLFIEDTNNGRIIIGDSVKSKLEYVKRIDEQHISTLFWSRLILN